MSNFGAGTLANQTISVDRTAFGNTPKSIKGEITQPSTAAHQTTVTQQAEVVQLPKEKKALDERMDELIDALEATIFQQAEEIHDLTARNAALLKTFTRQHATIEQATAMLTAQSTGLAGALIAGELNVNLVYDLCRRVNAARKAKGQDQAEVQDLDNADDDEIEKAMNALAEEHGLNTPTVPPSILRKLSKGIGMHRNSMAHPQTVELFADGGLQASLNWLEELLNLIAAKKMGNVVRDDIAGILKTFGAQVLALAAKCPKRPKWARERSHKA